MPVQLWFPTSIYFQELRKKSNARYNRELLKQCEIVREIDEEGQVWSERHYANGYTSYGSITDLHRRFPHFEELAQDLHPHAKRFAKTLDWDLQDGKLELTSMWINMMPTHTAHSLHLHPLSVISGTYYVKTPKSSSAIKFEDPRLDRLMATPPRHAEAKKQNQNFVNVQPKAGQVGLWESWLRHEVPSNRSVDERVSISFNYDWI